MLDADGEWVELSQSERSRRGPHAVSPPSRDADDSRRRASRDRGTIATHVGTHVEVPKHRFPDGKTIDEYPPERWITHGHVVEVSASRDAPIEPEGLVVPEVFERGDALLVRTGWKERVGEEAYFEPQYFSEATASRIADLGPSWVGIDAPAPEIPDVIGAADSAYPIHSILLGADVLIAENLTNLESLVGRAVRVVALPLQFVGAEAANARIVARPK